jgi:hypothetical protein
MKGMKKDFYIHPPFLIPLEPINYNKGFLFLFYFFNKPFN